MHKEHDFNLLKVLVMIYQYRNLTTVAAHLGKTESAVSKHLSKLREQLKDPLFVRTVEGFEPTHYLERIIPGIEQGLKSVEQALQHGETFDAENYEQSIRLAFYNVALEQFGEPIYQAVREAFPKAMIELRTWRESTYQDLGNGKIHLGVQIFNEDCPKSIYQTNLFHIEIGALVGRQSSIQTWQDVFEHPSIFFEVRGWNDIHQRLIKLMDQNNYHLDYRLRLDNLTTTYQVLRQHNYSALLARHLVAGSEFRFIPFPENIQPHTPLVACMKQSNRQSPLHMMLHKIVKKVMSSSNQ
ncbi:MULTISPECIES: LysR family transcriptional regulator [Vibrio]|uniref:LysR family transcriptional regulator n=1 Tax=Vibrio TaxID=662 RepID=UPI003D0F5772